MYRHLSSSCAAVWREAARALLPLLAEMTSSSNIADGERVGNGDRYDARGLTADGAASPSFVVDAACGGMPDVLPTYHPRGGGVVSLASGRVGTLHVILQSKHIHLMTASMVVHVVYVTNLTPGSEQP
jgi:hypothetical protein